MPENLVGVSFGLSMLFAGLAYVLVRLESIVGGQSPARIFRFAKVVKTLPIRQSVVVPDYRVGRETIVEPNFVCVIDTRDVIYFDVHSRFYLLGRIRNPGGVTRLEIQTAYSYFARVLAYVLFSLAVILALFLGDGRMAAGIVLVPFLAISGWVGRGYRRRFNALVSAVPSVLEAIGPGQGHEWTQRG